MNRDQPGIAEILLTVQEFIDEITDQLQGQDRYHALCASYLLAVAQREVALGPIVDAEEAAALSDLPDDAALFAQRLRSGELDDQWEALAPRVLQHVINKVRISRPDHLDPMHRRP